MTIDEQNVGKGAVMTKAEAINKIKEIQGGGGVGRSAFPEEMKGNLAKRFWENGEFSYGME